MEDSACNANLNFKLRVYLEYICLIFWLVEGPLFEIIIKSLLVKKVATICMVSMQTTRTYY